MSNEGRADSNVANARVRNQTRGTIAGEQEVGALMGAAASSSDSVTNVGARDVVEAGLAPAEALLGEALFGPQGPFAAPPEPDEVESSDEGLVEAWHASYGDSVSPGALDASGGPSALVLGHDDRSRVNDTTLFPFRCICSLIVTAGNGTRWVGTGWLVGPRLIATAGHNVFMHKHGGWSRIIEVIPGRNGSIRPFGTLFSKTFQSTRGWTVEKRPEFDYAGIVLAEPIGDKLGYFGYKSLDDAELKKSIANVVGYPGDKKGPLQGTLWGQSRGLAKITANTLRYTIDTAGGQSGCPVFRADKDDFYGIGIHNYGDQSGNSATRINAAVFDNLEKWQK